MTGYHARCHSYLHPISAIHNPRNIPDPDPIKTLQRMRKAIIISLLSCFAATAGAQTFIDRLQKKTAGQGVVTVTQDEAVSNLVNGPRTATAPSRSNIRQQKYADGTENGKHAGNRKGQHRNHSVPEYRSDRERGTTNDNV